MAGSSAQYAEEALAPILDRSGLRILLCERDPIAAEEELRLLRRCHYQVTAVKTARQVVNFLSNCGSDVDLILTEVELPKDKGFKLLKHIVRQERLKRIPIVMMSRRDEMTIVVKCLKLGAADYLVKPLRTNELLNLWTHMWRRQKMLGLAEKHVVSGNFTTPFELLISDTSESNHTNSTNFFSDDTDDRTRAASTLVPSPLGAHDLESEMSSQLELSLKPSLDLPALKPSMNSPTVKTCTIPVFMPSPPRKTELKVGESSAFFIYTKSINERKDVCRDGKTACKMADETFNKKVSECPLAPLERHTAVGVPSTKLVPETFNTKSDTGKTTSRSENGSGEVDNQDSANAGLNPLLQESPGRNLPQQLSTHGHLERYTNFPATPSLSHHFLGGAMMNSMSHSPVMVPPSMHLYHNLQQDDAANATPGLSSIIAIPPTPGLPVPSTFPYYPFGMHMAPHFGTFGVWPAMPAPSMVDRKICHTERREAALNKFRRKRKDRCFEKKIRYVSRKKLAEQRPRIRGQFVRTNHAEMNEMEAENEYDDEEDEPEDSELAVDSSPERLPVEVAKMRHRTKI